MKQIFSRGKIALLGIILLAVFVRFYRLGDLMIFGGDVARDYLVARDITYKGVIPLLGSPSSIPWLHQGSFFTYLLGIVLWAGKYNPLAGGYFVGVLGVLGVLGVYLLAKKLFSEKVGLWSAFFYSTSPLVVIFDRYPYHQSLISLFTVLFFLFLYLSVKKNMSFFVLSSLVLGLLMQLELSNIVLAPILIILMIDYRKMIKLKILIFSVLLFLSTWITKIIYDFSHGFTQTFGFVAWMVHKILPFGLLADGGQEPSVSLVMRLEAIFKYFTKMIFWPSWILSVFLLLFLIVFLLKGFAWCKRKEKPHLYIIVLWFLLPILGLLVQGSPSGAYMPIFFALPAILFGSISVHDGAVGKTVKLILLLLVIYNGFFLVKNDYLMLAGENNTALKQDYNMGQSFKIQTAMAKYLVEDSKKEKYNLIPLGSYAQFPSGRLDLTYLGWYFGNEPSNKAEKIKYYIFNKKDTILFKNWQIKEFPYMLVAKEIK